MIELKKDVRLGETIQVYAPKALEPNSLIVNDSYLQEVIDYVYHEGSFPSRHRDTCRSYIVCKQFHNREEVLKEFPEYGVRGGDIYGLRELKEN